MNSTGHRTSRERRAIDVGGIVQGVGFRPFVFHLAKRWRLHGFVKNHSGNVIIEVEGNDRDLDGFLVDLVSQAPPLAQVEHLSWQARPLQGEPQFRIEASVVDLNGPIFISPDVATCADCLAELFDPQNRRFRYPFLNCTNCGPRLTIIRGAPYDRARTTMATFPMCAPCQAEYDDPNDRRFHAQPSACPVCGPALELRDRSGDALAEFIAALQGGAIGALKGLGGYHLVCDARAAGVVAELRRRKHRDEKPFALMVQDLAAAETLCDISHDELDLLMSPRRPIVLLRKRSINGVAQEVSLDNPWLGVMLPYTPLHHLLLHDVSPMPLVMTSGNRSDEPIAYVDAEALEKLAGIADCFLLHNRPIHVRCEDSVTRIVDGMELPVRRSRGDAPKPITLPIACVQPILAVGGQLKGTFALGRDRHAFLSHHLGDLDHFDAYRAFERDIKLYEELFDVQPEYLVHDLHPDYVSTHYAQERAAHGGIGLLAVQHHHAHMASCMAEHGLTEPVIGVTFDGTGFGTDGAIWGGEFLVGDYRSFRRAAHLRYVGMPGGAQAIRAPWRMALAHLVDAQVQQARLLDRLERYEVNTVLQMIERHFQTPPTSSVGRLFDAVAALTGVADHVSYEGQAAIRLEALAASQEPDYAYPFALEPVQPADPSAPFFRIDTRPLIAAIAEEGAQSGDAALIARRFHTTLVELIVEVCRRLRQATQRQCVVLSGGVFLNALLTTEVSARLKGEGFRIYRHRRVPPNDGGLSLGQLAIAAAQRSEPS